MKKYAVLFLWIVLIVLGFFLATNGLAYALRYPAELGPAHFGDRWYQPFHLFWWLFILRIPNIYLIPTLALLGVWIAGVTVGAIYLHQWTRRRTTDLYGSSRWMKNKELKALGVFKGGGVVLGQSNDARYRHIGRDDTWKMKKPGHLIFNNAKEHVLVVAPTRRGKGINFVIPTLLSWTRSVIVYDIKKENWAITAGWRRKFSHVLRFEPTSPTTIRFNPMLEIDKGEEEIAQVQNLVEILTNPHGQTEKDHWNLTASQLLVGAILHVLYAQDEPQKTLSAVYNLLNHPERSFDETLDLMLSTQHTQDGPHQQVAQTARNMKNKAPNELSSVVSTASSYLSLYQDPTIARTTETSDFRISDLMNAEHPVSLYIVVNPQDADRLRPLTRLLLQMTGTKLTKTLGNYKHRLLYLIDEFPTLGNLEFFERQLAFFAGYGIKCALVVQSFNQLYKHYSKQTSIPDNCRYKLMLGADSPEEAELLTKYLGQETVSRTSVSKSGSAGEFLTDKRSYSESEVGRTLMTADEVLRLPFDDILLVTGGAFPYRGKKIMWFLDKRFTPRGNINPPDTVIAQADELPTEEAKSPWTDTAPKYRDANVADPPEQAEETQRVTVHTPTPAFYADEQDDDGATTPATEPAPVNAMTAVLPEPESPGPDPAGSNEPADEQDADTDDASALIFDPGDPETPSDEEPTQEASSDDDDPTNILPRTFDI